MAQRFTSKQEDEIGDEIDLLHNIEHPGQQVEFSGQQVRPQALPPKLKYKLSMPHDLRNCGVVCPPLAEGEKEYEPIQQPTRPLKITRKVHNKIRDGSGIPRGYQFDQNLA